MNEEELFFAAIQIETSSERAQFLDDQCGGNQRLRQRIEALIRSHEGAGTFLHESAAPTAIVDDLPLESVGSQIGPYKLIEEINSGVMGVVFRAQQRAPLERIVALKVLKPRLATQLARLRFDEELGALARMDHPNIAKVLEAGTTPSGRPFFAMEFIDGIPITKFCDENQLTLNQRLELFVPVCRAIQHAHLKGIVHLDIAPPNVMITKSDGRPIPKVIDFGISAATGQKVSCPQEPPGSAGLAGTFQYMSPEQAEIKPENVDTRSDIYSLGSLLYELVAGSTPLRPEQVNSLALGEILRQIIEVDPPEPSNRRIEAGKAKSSEQIPAEVDWLVMKALKKDRNERFETANDFAITIQHYLDGEPLKGFPGPKSYVLRKFVQRNKASVAAACALGIALLAGTVGTSWQAVRATRAEKQTEQHLATEKTERQRADENAKIGLEALEKIYLALEKRLPNDPFLTSEDRDLLVQLLDFYERFADKNSFDPTEQKQTAHAFWRVSLIQDRLGNFSEAKDACDRSIAILKEVSPRDSACLTVMARSFHTLENMLSAGHRIDEAKNAQGEVTVILDKLESECRDQPQYRHARSSNYLNQVRIQILENDIRGVPLDLDQAKATCEQGVNLLLDLVKEHPEQINYWRSLASAYNQRGVVFARAKEFQASKECYELCLDSQNKWRQQFPRDPGIRCETGTTQRNLGILLRKNGQLSEAREAYRKAEAEFSTLISELPNVPYFRSEMVETLHGLALCSESSDSTEARDLALRELEQIREAAKLTDSPALAWKHRNALALLASTEADLKRHVEASQAAVEFIKLANRTIDFETGLQFQLECIVLAKADGNLESEERDKHIRTYADRAVVVLREAVAKQFMKFEQQKSRPELQPLLEIDGIKDQLSSMEHQTTVAEK